MTFGVGSCCEVRVVSHDTMEDIEELNGRIEIELSYGYTLGSSSGR